MWRRSHLTSTKRIRQRADHHVVHVGVPAQPPIPGQWIEAHSLRGYNLKSASLKDALQFGGGHEPVPVMCATWKPRQHVLRCYLCQRKGLQCLVDRCHDHQAAGLEKLYAAGEKSLQIGDMLDDLHAEDDVEGEPFFGQHLG